MKHKSALFVLVFIILALLACNFGPFNQGDVGQDAPSIDVAATQTVLAQLALNWGKRKLPSTQHQHR